MDLTWVGRVYASWWMLGGGAAMALFAGWLAWRAMGRDWWIGRRALREGRTRRRCPKCWYDLAGLAALSCPECGHIAASERALRRSRRRWGAAGVAMVLCVPVLLSLFARWHQSILEFVLPERVVKERGEFGSRGPGRLRAEILTPVWVNWLERFGLRYEPKEMEDLAIVTIDGERVYEKTSRVGSLGLPMWTSGTESFIGNPIDLDADGTEELVVASWSGGAHCCWTVAIFELGGSPRLIEEIDAQNGMGIVKESDVTGVPTSGGPARYLLDIPDQSFCYWNAPYVASPKPSVYSRLEHGRLVVALDVMLARPIDWTAYEKEAGQLNVSMSPDGAALEPRMWGGMLELLYRGRDDLAQQFFDLCWPNARPGQEEFLDEFHDVLDKSDRWQAFQAARGLDH